MFLRSGYDTFDTPYLFCSNFSSPILLEFAEFQLHNYLICLSTRLRQNLSTVYNDNVRSYNFTLYLMNWLAVHNRVQYGIAEYQRNVILTRLLLITNQIYMSEARFVRNDVFVFSDRTVIQCIKTKCFRPKQKSANSIHFFFRGEGRGDGLGHRLDKDWWQLLAVMDYGK